jgi:hypothetical protein
VLPLRHEAWFGGIPLFATQSLAGIVIGTCRETKQKRRPKAPCKLSKLILLQGRQEIVVAAAEVVVQADLNGVDGKVMIEGAGAEGASTSWTPSVQ